MPEHVYKFPGNFGDDGYQPYHIGRLRLASGAVVRMVFTEEGLQLLAPAECSVNKDIIFMTQSDETNSPFGIK